MKKPRTGFTHVSILILMISFTPFLTGCTYAKRPEAGTAIRILSRRLAYHGMEKWPDHFKTLGRISQSACEISQDKDKALQGAFENITRVIFTETHDPLLRADLMALLELTGIKQDLHFKILSLPPDGKRNIEVFVCSFAEGTRIK